jgi:hypothetical protein
MTSTEPARSEAWSIGDRLHLDGAGGTSLAALRGTWDPQTASLEAEIPWLVAELQQRGVRIFRVAYNPARWDAAPRTAHADGRIVHLGLFRSLAPNLLVLQGSHGERVDLTVPAATAA